MCYSNVVVLEIVWKMYIPHNIFLYLLWKQVYDHGNKSMCKIKVFNGFYIGIIKWDHEITKEYIVHFLSPLICKIINYHWGQLQFYANVIGAWTVAYHTVSPEYCLTRKGLHTILVCVIVMHLIWKEETTIDYNYSYRFEELLFEYWVCIWIS